MRQHLSDEESYQEMYQAKSKSRMGIGIVKENSEEALRMPSGRIGVRLFIKQSVCEKKTHLWSSMTHTHAVLLWKCSLLQCEVFDRSGSSFL